MAQAARKEELSVPEGGIAQFIMDDDEIEQVYGSEAEDEAESEDEGLEESDGTEEYGDQGIAQFPALTKKMAALGREGDNVVAHVQTGELVIPLALIESDPELKEGLFERLRQMGIDDPQRYVVGSSANSINPVTGAPEFFLKKVFGGVKKVFKSVAKGVSNVIKGVVKVVKKVAPIVLPIVLSMTQLGPIYGAAMGSGLGTLISGGSISDALKSGLIGGAAGAVFQGVTGPGSFTDNVRMGLADPAARFSQTVTGARTSLSNVFGGESARAANAGQPGFFSDYVPASSAPPKPPVTTSEAVKQATAGAEAAPGAAAPGAAAPGAAAPGAAQPSSPTTPYKPRSFMESLRAGEYKEAFFPPTPTAEQLALAQTQAYDIAAKTSLANGGSAEVAKALGMQAAQNVTAASIGPGLLRTYGPLAALGTGVAAAAGAFKQPKAEPLNILDRGSSGDLVTGETLIEQDPSTYLVSDLGAYQLNPETGEYEVNPLDPMAALEESDFSVPTTYNTGIPIGYLPSSNPGGPFARPYVTQAAQGGAIFPRRNGGILPDEGVAGKDSVRAMLMPGEFVMTTDAVRGLGNGNVKQGIKNMYAIMRNLEARGRATA
jgi:hypothetical protein